MNADPTPAEGGLSPDTSLAPDVAASAEPSAPASEPGDDNRVASAREALAEAMADRVTWGDGTEYIAVEDAARIIAARTEAADRELARVTAAVEALADQWEADDYICGEDYAREVRAALSSADVALSKGHSDTALDDLLDRERAKAWDEGVDWAWTPGHGDLRSDNPYRAAAVSPEGGDV